jgi:hypothetical protein
VNLGNLIEGFVYWGIIDYLAMYFNQYVGLDDVWAGRMVGVLTAGITINENADPDVIRGYAGKILRVDLTTGRVKAEKLDPSLALQTIGGRGMNSTRLALELKKDIDPMSPENLLILGWVR